MLLGEFLSLVRTHEDWVAYAFADAMPIKILGGSEKTLEAKLTKKTQCRVQLELCLEPHDASLEQVPRGSIVLQAEVTPLDRMKSGWRCQLQILDADDVLEKRRAPRMQVHRMRLIGCIEGDSTWVFPITVRDVGTEGIGIVTREILEIGAQILLSGFQEFFPDCQDHWRFEVRSIFGKFGMGLFLLPGQVEESQLLSELHLQLGVVGRFWRALVGHARKQTGADIGNDLRVSIEFSAKQLRQRRAAQLTLISDSELEALLTSLKDEEELQRIKQELEVLRSSKKLLTANRPQRVRQLEQFLGRLQQGTNGRKT